MNFRNLGALNLGNTQQREAKALLVNNPKKQHLKVILIRLLNCYDYPSDSYCRRVNSKWLLLRTKQPMKDAIYTSNQVKITWGRDKVAYSQFYNVLVLSLIALEVLQAFFGGYNKYHISRKSDQDNRIPHLGILSSINDVGALEDASFICHDTISVASFMASGVGYCLPMIILASVYKRLNEISHSSHPGRGGGYFSAHFLYVWLVKNFDAYEPAGETSSSPGMVKFSGLH
ncbi:LOW QUALITY PROTEIN: hypothetical protein Cgig2_024366 [Carnegiea gigantea]|uniref:Uncharacterized protein n=1 Tax=Carnegiea gigantea TaxID=171969 RepID=A0A9Q1JJT8_9CARY|nr:LOW QUALITY PROTEIN: hypothetical protein Cgig2_024366 [Carnegiea gigantea]